MHFTCRSFIGKSQEGSWSQYWENEPDDLFLVSQKGHLFGLISLKSNSDSKQASDFGHQIIQKINKSYFSSSDINPTQQLKNTLNSITSDFDPQISQPTIILAVIFQQTLHLATHHTGHCILHRLHQISPILVGKNGQIATISGPFQSEDLLFLCTDPFFQKISWPKIKDILSQDSIQDIEESALSSLYSFEDQANLSAALIQPHTPQPSSQPDSAKTSSLAPPASPVVTTTSPSKGKKSPWVDLRQKLFKKKDIYVPHRQTKQINKRRKMNIIIAFLLLSALAISSVLGFRKNQAAKAEAEFQSLSQQVEEKIKNAKGVKNLNIDSAKELAGQADSLCQQMHQLNIHSDQVQTYQSQIQDLLAQTGSSENLDIVFFHDTSLISSQPQYSQMIFSSSNLCLMDSSFGRVDCVSLQKSHKNVSISDDIKQALTLLESSNNFYILTSKNISQIKKTTTTAKVEFSTIDTPFVPLDIQSWNSALYLLTDKSILKTTPSGSDFSDPTVWLQAEDFSNPSSFAINGKIWVLSSDGQLQPYIRGKPDSYQSSWQDKITKAENLITAIDGDLLAFTADQNLIYVYKKNGELSAKYNLGDKKIHDIALDESTNILYILCHDQKIYQITL